MIGIGKKCARCGHTIEPNAADRCSTCDYPMRTEHPSKAWTDNDPQFAQRISRIATWLMYGADIPADTDPLDVAAAKLWLEYAFQEADQ